jgi:fibronectin-binding autotransporter adhesin
MVKLFTKRPLAVLLCSLGVSAAYADTHTVLNTNDNGAGSLREAIAAATSNDTIVFADGLSGTITLSASLPIVDKTLTITGPGADALTISGAGAHRIFGVKSNSETDSLTLSGLTLAHGGAGSPSDGCGLPSGYGGAICSVNANLVIADTIFSQNVAQLGGALLLYDMDGSSTRKVNSLSLQRCVFTGNQASSVGSAVFVYGPTPEPTPVTVDRSEFSGNSGGNSGAALSAWGSATTVSNSSFLNNSATGVGAAMSVSGGDVRVVNSTFSGNQAAYGGAIYSSGNNVLVESSTLYANLATTPDRGDALYAYGYVSTPATVSVRNSILAGHSGADAKFDGAITATVDYSLIQNPTGIPADSIDHSLTGIAPQIGTLASLGVSISPTYSHAMQGFLPQSGSRVINAGDPSSVGLTAFDTRGTGYARVQGGRVDLGAIESNYPQTLPGAPTLARVIPGSHSMSLHFTAPVSDGGAVIDQYLARCIGGSVVFTATGSASPITVSGLTAGDRYTCSVAVHNAVGYSPYSTAKTLIARPPGIVPILFTILD